MRGLKLIIHFAENIKIEAGVPQGSVIAPTLYILFINKFPANHIINPDVLQLEMNRRRHIYQYADDTTIGMSFATPSSAHSCMSEWLKLITSFCHENKIRINPSKSAQLFFKNAHKHPKNPPPLTLEGEIIPIKTSTKYLGVTITRHLSWKQEVNSRINKVKAHHKTIGSLKYRGISTSTLVHIYKSKIRPLLTHTTPILGLINKTDMYKIEKAERKILQIIFKPLGQKKCIKTVDLYSQAKILPVKEFIHNSINRYLIKNQMKNSLKIKFLNSPIYQLYSNYWPEAPHLIGWGEGAPPELSV